MASVLMKIVIFSLILNLSVGLMAAIVPEFSDTMLRGGIANTDDSDIQDLSSKINNSIVPSNQQSNEGLGIVQWFQDLTMIKGILSITSNVQDYMFGFVKIMENFFGGYMDTGIRTLFFGGIKSLLTFMYGLFVFQLLTGRQIL